MIIIIILSVFMKIIYIYIYICVCVSRVWYKTASSGKAIVLKLSGVGSLSFVAITPRSTLTQGGSTC